VVVAIRDDQSVRALERRLAEREAASGRDHRDLTSAGLLAALRDSVLHQDAALQQVARAVALGISGLGSRERGPLASLGFFGPTGCGKNETARTLRLAHRTAERTVIRMDMTEFSDPTSLGRLIGSNRGYVGYSDRATLLTTLIRSAPDAVVIFDEFEKAHPLVQDTLLQIFEEGSLTDGGGSVARFDRAIVIVTSNLGASAGSRRSVGFVDQPTGARSADVLEGVRRGLRPELLGRFDAVVVFDPLDRDALVSIASKQVKVWMQRAAQSGWRLQVDPGVEQLVVDGSDAAHGARGLQRSIDRQLVEPLLALPCGGYRAVVDPDEIRWIPN